MRNPEFHKILEQMGKLHDAKNADYGQDTDPLSNFRAAERFGVPAWVGALIRAGDKQARLETFATKGTLKNESVEDSLLDLANYAVLALVLYREACSNQAVKVGDEPYRPIGGNRKSAQRMTDAELSEHFHRARERATLDARMDL